MSGDATEDGGNVCTATFVVESAYELAQFFRGVAQGGGVPTDELLTMRSMPMHHMGRALIAGSALPTVWYKTRLPGADDLLWVLYEAESLFGQRLEYQPYDGASFTLEPGRIRPEGVPMSMQGWTMTVRMVMNPDTTLATIRRHQQLVNSCMAVRGGRCRLRDNTGLLRVPSQG
jgi:hypothetical protein